MEGCFEVLFFRVLFFIFWFTVTQPSLHGVFAQRILPRGGGKNTPYLTPKPKVMGTPNLAFGLMFTKIFQKIWFCVDDVSFVMSRSYF